MVTTSGRIVMTEGVSLPDGNIVGIKQLKLP